MYVQARVAAGHFVLGDGQTPWRQWQHNDQLGQLIHHALVPLISYVAGVPVRATYSYLVKYMPGAALPKHTDRGQCLYSLSMLLDYAPEDKEASWPMTLTMTDGSERQVWWPVGSVLAYKGMDVPHARGNLPAGHNSINLFLHYTNLNDPIHNN